MRGIRCYLAYSPRLYKVIVLLLLPVVVLALEGLNCFIKQIPLFLVLSFMVLFYECMADAWYLGGLHSKDYLSIQWVQSSQKGLAFSKKVVLFDCLRKYVYMAVFTLADLLILYLASGKEAVEGYAGIVWCAYWLVTGVMHLATIISRFVCNITGSMLIAYGATVVVTLPFVLVLFAVTAKILSDIIMVVTPMVSVGFACLLVRIGYKKMEGSYYDS